MILKCTKCGGLYTANGASQEVVCSCSEEKTVLTEVKGEQNENKPHRFAWQSKGRPGLNRPAALFRVSLRPS